MGSSKQPSGGGIRMKRMRVESAAHPLWWVVPKGMEAGGGNSRKETSVDEIRTETVDRVARYHID